jgi:hypothetical protein
VAGRGCLGGFLLALGCVTVGRPAAPPAGAAADASGGAGRAGSAAREETEWARPLARPGLPGLMGIPCSATAPGNPGAYSGVVNDPVGAPLVGVRLRVRATPEGPVLRETRTGTNGGFVFAPAAGAAFIQVSTPGFPEVMFRAQPGVRCQVTVGRGNGAYDDPLAPGLSDAQGATVRFWGRYTTGFEETSFQPCGRRARWWVQTTAANDDRIQQARREARCRSDAFASCTIYLEVTAAVSGLGAFGNQKAYAREAHIQQVHAVSPRVPRTCR